MEERSTYPITYAVLSFLQMWGPSSGYDLKRGFDHALLPFFSVVYSQIYHELNRLHKLGWVEMETEVSASRPARKRYSITQIGREALADWQKQPLEKPLLRDELFLRTMFGHTAPPGALAASFRSAINEHEERLARVQVEVQTHGNPFTGQEGKRDDAQHNPYIGLVVQFEQAFEEAYLHWLHQALAYLESQEKQT